MVPLKMVVIMLEQTSVNTLNLLCDYLIDMYGNPTHYTWFVKLVQGFEYELHCREDIATMIMLKYG